MRAILVFVVILGVKQAMAQSPPVSPVDAVAAATISIEVIGRDKNGHDLGAYGTGFIVNSGGYALTAAHVYDELVKAGAIEASLQTMVHVADFTSAAIKAERVQDVAAHDITLLKLDYRNAGYPFVRLLCNSGFDLGHLNLYTGGFPRLCNKNDPTSGACLASAPRFVSSQGMAGTMYDSQQPDTMDVQITFADGASGSPVYLSNGMVVGLARGDIASTNSHGTFTPIWWADPIIASIPKPQCYDASACVNASTSAALRKSFTQTGGARAPGSGFDVQSKEVSRPVCYDAPDGYIVDVPVNVADAGNNAGRGRLGSPRYKYNSSGKPVGVCVDVTAWGEAAPFGAGGWQNVTISGDIQDASPHVADADESRLMCSRQPVQ